jgi:hypothetical protein
MLDARKLKEIGICRMLCFPAVVIRIKSSIFCDMTSFGLLKPIEVRRSTSPSSGSKRLFLLPASY